VIVLTVRDREQDKVEALDAGADDYVTKPFGMNELLARLRAQLRRATVADGADGPRVVATAAFSIDLVEGRARLGDGSTVHLTPKEWAIVELLARNPGRLVTQRQVLHHVWGEHYDTETHYLRGFMAQIRQKLEPDPVRPAFFVTEPGIGYRLEGVVDGPDEHSVPNADRDTGQDASRETGQDTGEVGP
ncbi:MAG: winged helix-turn-helix domain-containing protein, partial [Ilumatobacter sp.]